MKSGFYLLCRVAGVLSASKLECFTALFQRQSRQVNEILTPKLLHWRRRYLFLILFYAYGCLTCMRVLVLLACSARGGQVLDP